MPLLGSLTRAELRRRLGSGELVVRTGPFTTRIRSDIVQVAEGLARLYAAHPVEAAESFADFQVNLLRSRGWRRWVRPQVLFDHGGDAPFTPLPLAQSQPMFEWVMNWCVSNHAHSYLIVHAAVLEKHGRAIILPAPPGSGKSTLCAALAMRGWRLLSDELALVRCSDALLAPLVRPISLKNVSLDVIRGFAPGARFGDPVHGTIKGTIGHLAPPRDSVARAGELARAAWVVFPRFEPGAATSLAPVSKARTFMRLIDNAFNYALLGERGFEVLAQLVDGCTGSDFVYSSLDEAIAVFDGLAGDAP
ncbi:HprK-related kinase A [Massilia sp. G4R7]|uniref:HprK-related kinase A n=1 Tax=Massilia phyllostachyos TaxID=2898585 RepID=A0ABS8QCP9_9BURK|nr:HprK-related kinase A [Massilia phyllostachyos]MCD2519369.1 HprK-related kinase A [Massilia phyllostachyos]